jgi:hypothetical protein
LSTALGGDLRLQGNFTRWGAGIFADNKRETLFRGSGNSSITATAQDFAFLRINKTSGSLTLNCPVGITAPISGPDPQYRLSLESGLINTTVINLLTIGSVGVVVGGSAASFVNGPMAHITSANRAYSFPIGKGTAYKPMTFTATAGGGNTFTGEYYAGPTPFVDGDRYSTLIEGVQNNEYWDLSRTGTATLGTVTLPYTNPGATAWRTEAGGEFNLTNCWYCNVVVVKRRTTSPHWLPDSSAAFQFSTSIPETINWATSGTTNVTSKVISNFSPFTFGVGINTVLTLPVNLLSFTGQLQGGTAQLRWQIADDKTLAGFDLEYSTNAQNFKLLEKLAPAGLTYAAQHANLPGGTHFYRLKMTDKTGKVQYSRTVLLVKGAAQTTIVGLVQNPVVGNRALVELYSAKAQRVQAQVLDLAGRQVYQSVVQAVAGQQNLAIPLQLLLPGQYYLSVTTADGAQKTLRFGR